MMTAGHESAQSIGKRYCQPGIAQEHHRWMDNHPGILEQRIQACTVCRRLSQHHKRTLGK